MTNIEDIYNTDTRDAFETDALQESIVIAELIANNIIPKEQLIMLGTMLEGERPYLVIEALEKINE